METKKPVHEMAQRLLPPEIRSALPRRYSQEDIKDPIAHVHLFTPWSSWDWYVLEFDGEDRCFGLVRGFETELGYFSISELEALRGPAGLTIERDLYFKPTTVSELRRKYR